MTQPAVESRPLPPWAIVLVVAAGVALRLIGVRHGLPEFTDEAAPFRWALDMWAHPGGRIDWNPHHFIYPSLTLYLHLAVERVHAWLGQLAGVWPNPADYHLAFALDPTPMAIAARAVGAAADGVSLWALVRIGERLQRGAGLVAAALFAFSPVAIGTAHAVFTDPVMLAFALLALNVMLAYAPATGLRTRLAAAVLIGLATGAKYPAAVLLAPLAWTFVRAHGVRQGLRHAVVAGFVALVTFVVTTPYAVLDRVAFMRDLRFDRVLASEGLLGATAGASGWRSWSALAADLGPVAALLALAGLGLAFARARRDPRLVTLALARAGLLAPVLASPLRFERYLIGGLAVAALLAGVALVSLLARTPVRARLAALALLLAATFAPLVRPAAVAALARGGTTAGEARAWCEANLPTTAITLMEPYGPELASRRMVRSASASALTASASPAWQARIRDRRAWAVERVPTLVAGRCVVTLHPPSGVPTDVSVFEHASDFNRVLYDTRLLAGIDYFISTSAQRARFEADTMRYADACAFYRVLDTHFPVVARFESTADQSGPAIVVHRNAGTLPTPAPLGEQWWAERLPIEYRRAAARVLNTDSALTTIDPTTGEPAAWVRGARPLYDSQLATFAEDLAYDLIQADRPAPAQRLMLAALAVRPASQWTCLLAVEASVGVHDWAAVRAAIGLTRSALRGAAMDPALIDREREAIAHLGRHD